MKKPLQTHTQRIAIMREDAAAMRSTIYSLASTSPAVLKQHMQDSIVRIERMEGTIHHIARRANQILDIALKTTGLDEYARIWSISLHIEPYQMTMFTDKHDISVRFTLNTNGKKYKGDIKKCPLFKVMNFYMPLRWLDMRADKLRREMQKML